ncbi:MAG: arginase [Armatimonadota bacterium]|nr:arginase [Armatimonadota bacterium]
MFSKHHVRIIGVPMGLGGQRRGASLGPDALRLAGIAEQIAPYVESVFDGGNVCETSNQPGAVRGEGLGFFDEVLANLVEVRETVASAIGPNSIPVVLGGDHSIEMATVPAAVAASPEPLGVLWIDAHGDINTPDTSPSGNLHGMVLAAVCGMPCGQVSEVVRAQWQRLLDGIAPNHDFLDPARLVWLGLRDVDRGEAETISAIEPRNAISMHEVDRYGIGPMAEQAISRLKQVGAKRLWISFDADVLDPQIAPGTGTKVRGGLSYREAHLLAEILHETLRSEDPPFELVGVKIAEVNPILDQQNATATLCVEWLSSLFGKRILPAWD